MERGKERNEEGREERRRRALEKEGKSEEGGGGGHIGYIENDIFHSKQIDHALRGSS